MWGMIEDYGQELRALYQRFLDGWNDRSGEAIASLFVEDGYVIGFDGSQHTGRSGIARDLQKIFDDHPTPRYVGKARSVRSLSADAAVLLGVAGMVPPGKDEIEPALHTVQNMTAMRGADRWWIVSLQSTPAQYHGRPQLVEDLTEELQELLVMSH